MTYANPQVSIVLVTYNRAAVLPRTLADLSAQTYRDFQCFIMDDCSPDHTRAVAEAHVAKDPRFVYVRQPHNLRMPGNLNDGIRHCRGAFIAILHDDDIHRADMLEEWVGALKRHPGAGFVFNAYQALDRADRPKKFYSEYLPELVPGRHLLEANYFARCSFTSPVWGAAMIRRAVLEDLGLFDPRYGFYADVEMWMRISERYDVCFVEKPLISLSAMPRQFSTELWPTEWLIQVIFLDCRNRAFAGRPVRKQLERVRHVLFRMLKGSYLVALSLKHGRFHEFRDAWAYFFNRPLPAWTRTQEFACPGGGPEKLRSVP